MSDSCKMSLQVSVKYLAADFINSAILST